MATLAALFLLQATAQAQPNDQAAAAAVLEEYHNAIERLDLSQTGRLFSADSIIIEQGHIEGDYATYLAHHLGPEIAEVASFDFSGREVSVVVQGDFAHATETYAYGIEFKDGRVVERQGAASSVLRRDDGGWVIVRYHSSSRAPRPSP